MPPGSMSAAGEDQDGFALQGSRCETCGGSFFPRREFCPHCLDDGTMAPMRLSRRGTLYSFSVVHAAPKGFRAPYAIGYVDLPENVRVLAQISNWQEVELRSGMTLEVESAIIGDNPDGSAKESYAFRAIAADADQGGE